MRLLFTFSLLLLVKMLAMGQVITLPQNMYADTVHAPFLWGVASGDPLPDGVVLWTRPDPTDVNNGSQTLNYEVAGDAGMQNIISSGAVTVDASTDHCARVEVTGLAPATTYYYRFTTGSGASSVIGRTRTAPVGEVDRVKFAVASCSSVYSGFFNAYRRIAERDDIDLMIHLGDYIYDFVDMDERIRVPEPFPTVPANEEEWRALHRYHLLDPDLRAARQMHPWMVMWDNHDFKRATGEGIEAFYEYVPRRDVHGDIGKAHRSLRFGDLAEVTLVDIEKFRFQDTIVPGEPSALGHEQREWFLDRLGASTAKWRICGSQKMFSGWYSDGVPTWLPVPNDGEVFDRGSWDGFVAERDTILRFIQENSIDNFMMLSGDVHMSFAMDISRDPRNSDVYNPATGEGSLGVEFIPASISRGNFDEAGVPAFIVPAFESASNLINVHHQHVEFVQHGYGILDIRPDSTVAEWWYSSILQISESENLAKTMTVGNRQNRWRRPNGFVTTDIADATGRKGHITVFPNPNAGMLNVVIPTDLSGTCLLRVSDTMGREMMRHRCACDTRMTLSTETLSQGMYVLEVQADGKVYRSPFIRE